MVSPVSNSLNALFAASFSDVTRTTALTNPNKTNALDALKRIASDLPSQAIQGTGQQSQQQGQNPSQERFYTGDERQPSLSDYLRPKPSLAPTDEVALFTIEPGEASFTPAQVPFASVQAKTPSYIAQTVEEEQVQDQTSRRRQSYVAQLYAQTGDIAFSSDSFVNYAA